MGRKYEYAEWLQFECEGVELSAELEKLGEKFGERAIEVANAYLHSQYGPELKGSGITYNDEALIWNTYASIVGHGVGLWEEDGDTGLPPEMEGALDKIVKKDKKLLDLADDIQSECAGLKQDAGVEERPHAADFPSQDAAVRSAQSHGASHVVIRPSHVFAYNLTGDGYEKRELFFARGKLHWPSASVHVKTLPADAVPIESALRSRAAEEAPRGGDREIVRYRFEDEREWHRCSLASFMRHNEGLLDDEDLAILRSGGRVWYGGGAQPLGFIELVGPATGPRVHRGDFPRGGEPLTSEEARDRKVVKVEITYDEVHKEWEAVGRDRNGYSVNIIRGEFEDQVRTSARRHWPDAKVVAAETPQGGEPLPWWEVEYTYAGRGKRKRGDEQWIIVQARTREEAIEKVKNGRDLQPNETVTGNVRPRKGPPAQEDRRGGGPLPKASAPTEAKEEIPVEDAVPWVKITRDPELYAAGIERAKAIGPIDDGGKVYELLAPALSKEDQEVFLAVFLNVRQQCIGVTEIHRGERSRVAVSRADVLRGVVKTGADHFIIVHNHPSGDPTPSPADRKLTDAMMKGADQVDIPCIDHVVIGMGKYYSFAKGKVVKVRA